MIVFIIFVNFKIKIKPQNNDYFVTFLWQIGVKLPMQKPVNRPNMSVQMKKITQP